MALEDRRQVVNALAEDLRELDKVLRDWQAQRGELKSELQRLIDVLPAKGEGKSPPLVVMTLNLQYFASYPADQEQALGKLKQALGGPNPPDVICVQEGLASRDVLKDVGFELIICTGALKLAQSVREMVYSDAAALKACAEENHDQLLCNQLYLRKDSAWVVEDKGAERISSDTTLEGGGNRVHGPLAIRSMGWLKLKKQGTASPSVFVMCTHITGGRFEDQYFVQQLAEERLRQPERCIDVFKGRKGAKDDDIGILVGDFNATETYKADGPMNSYFKFGIKGSEGVKSDAQAANIPEDGIESIFAEYMVSPFKAIKELNWTFAYGDEIGVTSAFGHLIDHMAMSKKVPVKSVEDGWIPCASGSSLADLSRPLPSPAQFPCPVLPLPNPPAQSCFCPTPLPSPAPAHQRPDLDEIPPRENSWRRTFDLDGDPPVVATTNSWADMLDSDEDPPGFSL
mmetsp:Transcript_9169/g.23096  ORF Transcript_9169/g.23096 Transcript_9169/m.23096 type:complete len:457 (+) Transcript_9169:146-1516(+)